ncbi:M56 family metallopeptidase [Christiangramia sediminicola]|uniref:M56 family metallopeptidase n=1 Tax=Christiangramia sediminicola TaxID=3073267 RepID=A0ABU1EPR3_9FLAO|nr:M56 family metallopeptidase [Christiangramia sp. SM2212]MDR5590384.1 M56 family metallopeptidase [Christiangramia sp. SM2212]
MLIYFIKSVLCLAVLWSFYKVFLESEKAHVFKRFYLLGSLVLSIILPLITFSYTSDSVTTAETFVELERSQVVENHSSVSLYQNFLDVLPYILGGTYGIGVIFFSFRFFKNIIDIQKRINGNEKRSFSNYVLVLIRSSLDPHSFLSYIFLNKDEYETERISEEIILHEKAHADQKHSLDIILLELIQIIFWFNPLLIWFKRSAKLNHEFLADEQVVSKIKDASHYSEVLFQYAGGTHHVSLSSSINYSLTKKRIIMISKSFSIRKLLSKLGLLIPVLGCCIFLFNNEIVAKPALSNSLNIKSNPIAKGVISNEIQDPVIKIKVAEDKIWVNGKETKLKNFAAVVDKITKNWTNNELNGASIHMSTEDSNQRFMEKLNAEFSKTKLARVSDRDILPPPPPMPPAAESVPPPAPPAPVKHTSDMDEDASRMHRERAEEIRALAEEQRIIMKEEREKIRELQEELREDENITATERRKMIADVKRKESEMRRKILEVEREHMRAERAQARMRRDHPEPPMAPAPPPPPKPEKVIDDIDKAGGSFFYNGNKIDAARAKKIALEKKNINVHVKRGEDDPGKVEIFDNEEN